MNTSNKQYGEIIRFGIVGLTATAIQYGIYYFCLPFANGTIANTFGYIISFIYNYILTTLFTFRVKPDKKKAGGFVLSHIINWLLQTVFLNIFLALGIAKNIAPLPMFAVCVPINFLLVRHFVKDHKNK